MGGSGRSKERYERQGGKEKEGGTGGRKQKNETKEERVGRGERGIRVSKRGRLKGKRGGLDKVRDKTWMGDGKWSDVDVLMRDEEEEERKGRSLAVIRRRERQKKG